MKKLQASSWLATALALSVVGCSCVAPTTDQSATTPAAPPAAAATATERTILADGETNVQQLLSQLPRQISNTDANRMLVDLPETQIQGGLSMGEDRSTQQWRRGWRGRGFRYYRLGSFYYPYSFYGSYWSPYYYPYYYPTTYAYSYAPYYYYPYYLYSSGYYRPYRFRYYRRWW